MNTVPTNQQTPRLAAGNLNGDNLTDLVVEYTAKSGTVTPYFATGGGAFRKGASHSAGTSPTAVAIGKFNNDGFGDIAVATQTGVQILLGDSAGTFTTGSFIAYPYPSPQSIGFGSFFGTGLVLADFDKDGKLDLAVTTNLFVDVYWGTGTGSFSGVNSYAVQASPVSMLVADVNGDGYPDLAVPDNGEKLNVLVNRANRKFAGAINTASPLALGIVTADLNHDGKQDVAVSNFVQCSAPCNGKVSVLYGSGSGSLAAPKTYTIGMHGGAIAAGDVNGDGVLDLVVTNTYAGDNADTSVLLGIKGGGFQAARNYTLGALSNNAYLVDMNKDGKLDLVETGGVALGNGDGTFGPLKPYPQSVPFEQNTYARFTAYIGVGDFNGDGIHDVAAAFFANNAWEVWALIGDGKGGFTGHQLQDVNSQISTVVGLTVGKLIVGGPDDIVLANNTVDQFASIVNGQPVIFIGKGTGAFQEAALQPPLTDGAFEGTVKIADFNHDGIPDIGMSSGDQFVVDLGQGKGTFVAGPSFPVAPAFQTDNIAVADLNGDGWPDVLFPDVNGIERLINVPVPTVSPARLSYTANGTKTVTVRNTLSTTQSVTAALADPAMSAFKITAKTCNGALAPGATCTISVGLIGRAAASNDTLYVSAAGSVISQGALHGN